jgi:hypothetical protein
LCLPDLLDEVPADCHGNHGPRVQTLHEKWTGLSPKSQAAATKAREQNAEARRKVQKAAQESKDAYMNRNAGRRPR